MTTNPVYALWAPKAGAGVSVTAVALAQHLATQAKEWGDKAQLIDLAPHGDLPAILGLASDPAVGIIDWLAANPGHAAAFAYLAIDAGRNVHLIPHGTGTPALTHNEAEDAVASMVAALIGIGPIVIDLGNRDDTIADAVVQHPDVHALIVARACYVALRRATRSHVAAGCEGVIIIEEPGRSLGTRDVADVLGLPIVATVPVKASISRVVDAGVLMARIPADLQRAAEAVAAWPSVAARPEECSPR